MRRFIRQRSDSSSAGIEMSPLIDMVFILLIFFLVTTSFVKESGVELRRPESSRARAISGGFVPVAITADGVVHCDGSVIAADDVDAIAAALQRAGSRRIVIQADHQAPTGLTLRVQDSCLSAGAERADVAALGP